MKLFLSTVIWESALRKEMTQVGIIEIADKFGFAGIEFRPFWKDTVAEVPIIAEKLIQSGLEVTYACNDSILSNSMETTLNAIKGVSQSLLIADTLKAKILRFNLATSDFEKDFLNTEWWKEAVAGIIKQASSLNIVLAIENAPDSSKGDPRLLLQILSEFDSTWLRLTFDTGNWLYTAYSPKQAFDLLKDYIGYVHIKDIIRDNANLKHINPGSGIVDLSDLICQLQKIYSGIYTLEFPGAEDPITRIQHSLSFLSAFRAQ